MVGYADTSILAVRWMAVENSVPDAAKTVKQIPVIGAESKIEKISADCNIADANVGNSKSVPLAAEQNDNVAIGDPVDVLVGHDDFRTDSPSKGAAEAI